MNGMKRSHATNSPYPSRLLFPNDCTLGAVVMGTHYPDHEFSPTSPGAAHTRVSARESIFLAATIRFEGEDAPMPVRIRNISAGGMMIDSAVPRAKGLPLIAELKTIGKVAGTVAWSHDQRMGILFDRPIDPHRARLQVAAPQAPKKAMKTLFPA